MPPPGALPPFARRHPFVRLTPTQRMRFRRILPLLLLVACGASAAAQTAPPRFGVGFDVLGALPGQDLVPDGVALGLRGRVALPVNADLSVAGGLGVAANLFDGRSESQFIFNPQASLIVTLPGRGTARYVLGGFGGFLPSDGGGGPSLHAGLGWALPLNETSVFLELNPSLVVGENQSTAVLAARAGVIF